jgi:hypothetical protein
MALNIKFPHYPVMSFLFKSKYAHLYTQGVPLIQVNP